MPRPSKPSLPPDLISGAVSVLMLLVLVLGLHLPFLIGIAVAVAVYFGVSLLQRQPPNTTPTVPALADMLAELTTLSQKIAAHAIRIKISEIVTQARALVNYLQSRPDEAAMWQDYVRDCLTSAVAGTRQFGRLSPYLTEPTDPAVVKFSEFLTTLSQTLGSVYKKLLDENTADFTSQIDMYKSTLNDINQVYLGGGKSE